jgi:DNA-binding MarR family transcriptional regulator
MVTANPFSNKGSAPACTGLEHAIELSGIYIGERYNYMVSTSAMTAAEFRALAEFRYQIRIYLNGSEEAARKADLEPQQYLLMLALRGLPAGREASIRELAERMQLRHHSVVELVDRLERRQLLRRERSRTDRRQVILHLTPRGEKILTRLAKQRISELRTSAPALVRSLTTVIRSTQSPRSRLARSEDASAN